MNKYKKQGENKQAKTRCLICGKKVANDPVALQLHAKAKHQTPGETK